MKTAPGLLFGIGISLVQPIVEGIVLTVLWAWFVVPQFGVGELSLVPAIGLCLILGLTIDSAHHYTKQPEEDTTEKIARVVFYAFVRPLLVLGIGWVFHHLM